MQIYARKFFQKKLFFFAPCSEGRRLKSRKSKSICFIPSTENERKINKNVLTDVDLKIKINKKEVLYTKKSSFFLI